MAGGAFSIFCSKYISETTPIEIKGSAGGLTQCGITFGILIPFAIGRYFNDVASLSDKEVSTFLLIVFSFPIALSLFQLLMLFTVFNFDSPKFMKQKKDFEKLEKLMRKIYNEKEVDIKQLINDLETCKKKDCFNITYTDVLTNPRYRRATFVGCMLAMMQMTNGINIIIYFSNILFEDTGLPVTEITGLVGIVNFLACIIGVWVLSRFGRRFLMLYANFVMTCLLFTLGSS